MADYKQQQITEARHLTTKTALMASAAAAIIGGPLLGLTAISFAATTTLLLVTSPLFLIFSPVLFGAACLFALVMIGFATAFATAVAGMYTVAWVFRSSRRAAQFSGGG